MLDVVQIEPSYIKKYGLLDLVELSAPRIDAYLDAEGTPNPEFERLYGIAQAIGKGELQSLLTVDGLLEARRLDRAPAPRTFEGWV